MRLDRGLLADRLAAADALRRREFAEPFYRVVFGESDALPGLIVDRYGDVAVVQITTAGMERAKSDLVALLRSDFGFRTVVLRNDTPARALEGLESETEVVGDPIGETVTVQEGGGVFEAAPLTGQKTGWYYDHRSNRAKLAARVAGRRVLDLYSYTGAWGIRCALGGASEVRCIDSSANAIELLERNAARNGVAARVSAERSDAVRALKALRSAGERFDVVVLDPPAFIRRRKDRTKGVRGLPARERTCASAPRPRRLPRLGLVLGPPRARQAPRDHRPGRAPVRTASSRRGGRRPGPRPPRAPRPPRDRLPPGVLRRVRLSRTHGRRARARDGARHPRGEFRPISRHSPIPLAPRVMESSLADPSLTGRSRWCLPGSFPSGRIRDVEKPGAAVLPSSPRGFGGPADVVQEDLPMSHSVPPATVEYPCSDGQPMAESDVHARCMMYVATALRRHFARRAAGDVYVSTNSFLYYERGNPRAVVAPDVYVVIGAPGHLRDSYLLWNEPKGPDFVLEATSKSTRREDVGRKRDVYAALGVTEYFLYDPRAEYLTPALQGNRLEHGRYRPLPTMAVLPDRGTTMRSEVLGLELRDRRDEQMLRLRDPATGRDLPTYEELDEAHEAAQAAQQAAKAAQQAAQARIAELEARLRDED